MNMDRKKALITGASRGIGRAIAQTFARAGFDLYLTCHTRMELLETLAKELETQYGVACECFCFPISDEKAVRKISHCADFQYSRLCHTA